MKFFRLLTSLIVLGLLIVAINSAPSFQHDVLHIGQEPYEDNFENSVDSWPVLLVESDTPEETVNEEHNQQDSVHREKRALPWFNSGQDTNSNSAREAFRKAKDQNGIARSQSPIRQYYVPDKHNPNQMLRQYDFRNQYGEMISIRKDRPITYPDGGSQGPHYNAGPTGGKLRQHHNFQNRQKG